MSTRIRVALIALGALLGVLPSWYFYGVYHAYLAAGESAAGTGLGVATVLFLYSIPWSGPVVLIGGLLEVVGIEPGLPLFLCMPPAAGAGWMFILLRLRDRWRARRDGWHHAAPA